MITGTLPALLLPVLAYGAQTLYIYADDDGSFVYSDHVLDGRTPVETRELEQRPVTGGVTVTSDVGNGRLTLVAHNDSPAPAQFRLVIDRLQGVRLPPSERGRDRVLPANSVVELVAFDAAGGGSGPGIDYRYRWLSGDPAAEHRPSRPYRAPFATATHHLVTQAWPDAATHDTADSRHAVDIAMPVGTGVYAARAGIVIQVEGDRFRSGIDAPLEDANLIRVLHDDGTFAVYAHLNRSTIRVRVGEHVERGDYVADSGNTGRSSGPHLHFAVTQNGGFHMQSVPVEFEGQDGEPVSAVSGAELTAF